MKRNSGKRIRSNGYYNQDLLYYALKLRGFASPYALAKAMRQPQDTISRVFNHVASQKKVKPVSDFLGVKWDKLHDLDLPQNQYHRAVLNGIQVPCGGGAVSWESRPRCERMYSTVTNCRQ